jgi:DNA-directed RNA polymerase subunit E'/Rpb7
MENTSNFKNNNNNNNYKKKREQRIIPIYSKSLITRNIVIPINLISKNIKQMIEKYISSNFEGRCILEGYAKPQSSKIITYSSGLIERGTNINFEVVFECDICFPVEGCLLSCTAKNITKAGIRCESSDEVPSPIVVFIARDHHYSNSYFADIKEGDKINVRVIGQRFELNDKSISIIGELIKQHKSKLVIEK